MAPSSLADARRLRRYQIRRACLWGGNTMSATAPGNAAYSFAGCNLHGYAFTHGCPGCEEFERIDDMVCAELLRPRL
jgi:hypothetical protein